jgi:hypothetical protein
VQFQAPSSTRFDPTHRGSRPTETLQFRRLERRDARQTQVGEPHQPVKEKRDGPHGDLVAVRQVDALEGGMSLDQGVDPFVGQVGHLLKSDGQLRVAGLHHVSCSGQT